MFNPGDIVYVKSASTGYKYIFIFKRISYPHIDSYYTYDLEDETGSSNWPHLMSIESFRNARLATGIEKEILLKTLFSQGKTFDKETLQIVDNDEI
jgi:hypothetical protein